MDSPASTKIKNWLGTGSINIFGPPFSGKDTQAHRLANELMGVVIAGGDILRSHEDQDTIKKLMQTGELFPTDFYLSIIIPYLSQKSFAAKPIILSSVGRWHGEEEAIIKATDESEHPLKAVISLGLSEAEIWHRFENSSKQKDRGLRHDDADHILGVRLKEFKLKTLPVIEYYKNKGLLIEIDGSQPVEKVSTEIVNSLFIWAKK